MEDDLVCLCPDIWVVSTLELRLHYQGCYQSYSLIWNSAISLLRRLWVLIDNPFLNPNSSECALHAHHPWCNHWIINQHLASENTGDSTVVFAVFGIASN